jgi:ribosomal protein S18 acetylase RimI-like enzyme
MINVNFLVRPAVIRDQQQIANLMFFETHVHRHLDWRTPLEWLGSPFYWVVENSSQIIAALACPQDPPGIAWVRLFAHAGHFSLTETWDALWETASQDLSQAGGATVAVIALHEWLRDLVQTSGFDSTQEIVMLEWSGLTLPQIMKPTGIFIRSMTVQDLPVVAEVDEVAFGPIWQNSLPALNKAFSQAGFATLAEMDGRIIGYQISTQNPFGAHLARLAVRPEMQGKGIGAALVADLTAELLRRGLTRLTVNTQDDNKTSLALYDRIGFRRTGEHYPVFTLEVPAE